MYKKEATAAKKKAAKLSAGAGPSKPRKAAKAGKAAKAKKAGTGCTRQRVAECRADGKVCKKDSAGAARCQIKAARKPRAAAADSKAKCAQPCTKTKSGTVRVRNAASCRCLAVGGTGLKKQGVCGPKYEKLKSKNGTFRSGKMLYNRVLVQTVYKSGPKAGQPMTRCIKAGGAVAKAALGNKACAPGKMLKRYTATVPDVEGTPVMRRGRLTYPTKRVPATRCVKDAGYKVCQPNQVLAMALFQGKPIKRCVTPKTAKKKGYSIVAQSARNWMSPAMSMGM